MKNKYVLILCEGDTDECFYRKLKSYLYERYDTIPSVKDIIIRNLKGCGNFKTNAVGKFQDFKRKHKARNCEYLVILCYDNDVFKFSKTPPFNLKALQSSLSECGAENIESIVCREAIEDWFLHDIDGILDFLQLKHTSGNKKVCGKNGEEKLQSIFKKVDKLYIKGASYKAEQFIASLDISIFINDFADELKPILNLFSKT